MPKHADSNQLGTLMLGFFPVRARENARRATARMARGVLDLILMLWVWLAARLAVRS